LEVHTLEVFAFIFEGFLEGFAFTFSSKISGYFGQVWSDEEKEFLN
jgi:hypothetical protein